MLCPLACLCKRQAALHVASDIPLGQGACSCVLNFSFLFSCVLSHFHFTLLFPSCAPPQAVTLSACSLSPCLSLFLLCVLCG